MFNRFSYFFSFLSIFYILSVFAINKEALDYLEKLREKEYVALKEVCIAGGASQQEIEKILQCYKDFKHIHAKKFFSEKNPDFFHDPKLAEFPMGDSNVLEETKKILLECGINPESISIRYQERYPGEKEKKIEEEYRFIAKFPKFIISVLDKIYKKRGASAYVDFSTNHLTQNAKKLSEITFVDNFVEKLHPQIFHQELVITKRGVATNYCRFRHTIEHEASHLLEGHVMIIFSTSLFTNKNYTNLWKKFCYRQEVIADVRRYFDSSDHAHLLNALRKFHLFVGKGKRSDIHPTCKSTYKRLKKINQMTWNIPFYNYIYFELGRNMLYLTIPLVVGWYIGKKLKWIRD